MHKSLRLSALVVSVTLFALSAQAGEPPAGFRNFKWGSHPRSGLKKITDTGDGLTMYIPTAAMKLPLFDLPIAEEDYSFSNGKFYSGDAYLDGEANFQKMKAALIKTFGAPSFSNDSLKLLKWKWPKSAVEVHLSYQRKFARTTVTFVNSAI